MTEDYIQNSSYLVEKDLNVCSFLRACPEVRLIKAERSLDGAVYFYFEPKDTAEKLISAYWSDSTTIHPRKLFSAQRDLKDLIFSQTGQNGVNRDVAG